MDTPRLNLVRESEGSDEAVVYIRGWLSQSKDRPANQAEWADALRAQGFRGAIYHLWWDAPSEESLLKRFGAGVVAGHLAGSVPGALGAGATSIYSHYRKSHKRARRTGAEHADAVLAEVGRVPESTFSIVAFSMGGRLTYSLLTNLSECKDRVQNVVLIGAAVRRDSKHDWCAAADAIRGNLVNLHSKNDRVLGYLYRAITKSHAPAGMRRIKADHPRIHNIDVSDAVKAGRLKWRHFRSVKVVKKMPGRLAKMHDGLKYVALIDTRAGHLLPDR